MSSPTNGKEAQPLDVFKAFLEDPDADDMYITGAAGTGKTTGLADIVQYCKDEHVDYTVCAFTHKACGILSSKLPPNSIVRTLHSYLKKRPGINENATKAEHVQINSKLGSADKTTILFIDEYSMVGEKDLMDIRDAQDDHEGLKVVWLGDPNQLPPVGDMQSVRPYGKYKVVLTKQYRNDNPLQQVLTKLISYINGEQAEPLANVPGYFIREQDILEWYNNDRMSDKFDGVMLAYTNERVQQLNAAAQGRALPKRGDTVFSPSTRERYTFDKVVLAADTAFIELPYGNEMLGLGTKYKTLEHVLKNPAYATVSLLDEDGAERQYLAIFGHYNYKVHAEELRQAAAKANAAIPSDTPAQWAKANSSHPLAKKRAKAWRDYLSFNECCICLDFAHAMTVHKSQGSTYDNVYIDMQDLAFVASKDYKLYLKLLYVAVSRATTLVVTN